jgi:ATP-dependent exoDNAse (exonuclease V) alpha subunit
MTHPKTFLSQFTDDQVRAWDLLLSDKNVFITGEAGSGKSFIIRHFMRGKDLKSFPVLASTGAAAVLIGGRTFHSFMGLGIMEGGVEATVRRSLQDKRIKKRLKQATGFIVDEISMLSGQTLQAAEQICQLARESEAPWGGLRVIAVGDFAQLPPIQNSFTRGSESQSSKAWAFLDDVWEKTNFHSVVLKQNMRSDDGEFLSILNDIRKGHMNDRVETFLNQKRVSSEDFFEGTRLFPRRNQTDAFNAKELEKLPGELFRFPTIYSGQDRSIEQLKKHSPLPEELLLKDNAMVMLRQNDPKLRWVNGSTGFVRDIKKFEITIELLKGKIITVEPTTFSMLNADGISMASVTNFPLSLAYAATIHKAQGMTLDRLMVNLNALWEPGQAYVALSRVIDPKNLRVEAWQPQSIKADPVVEKFYQSLMLT